MFGSVSRWIKGGDLSRILKKNLLKPAKSLLNRLNRVSDLSNWVNLTRYCYYLLPQIYPLRELPYPLLRRVPIKSNRKTSAGTEAWDFFSPNRFFLQKQKFDALIYSSSPPSSSLLLRNNEYSSPLLLLLIYFIFVSSSKHAIPSLRAPTVNDSVFPSLPASFGRQEILLPRFSSSRASRTQLDSPFDEHHRWNYTGTLIKDWYKFVMFG